VYENNRRSEICTKHMNYTVWAVRKLRLTRITYISRPSPYRAVNTLLLGYKTPIS